MADTERIYRLLVDASQATRQLKKVSDNTERISNQLNKFGNVAKAAFAGLAAGFTAGAFVGGINKAISSMDALTKEAQKVGTTASELQKFQYAAELSGVSANTLSTGFSKLTLAMADLGAGKATDATRALASLGVATKNADGTLRNTGDVIADVADEFKKLPDGAEKSTLAMQIFGRSGAQLVPLLNAGSDGLKAMGDEAERLGLVFDEDLGRASELFNDNMTRLKKSTEGAFLQLAQGLLPSLVGITDELSASAGAGNGFIEMGYRLGQALSFLVNGFQTIVAVASNATEYIKGVGRSWGTIAAAIVTGEFSQIPSTLDSIWQQAATNIKANNKKIVDNWNENLQILTTDSDTALNGLKERFKKDPPKLVIPVQIGEDEEGQTSADYSEKKLKAYFDKLQKQADAITQSVKGPEEVLKEQLRLIDELQSKGFLQDQEVVLKATTQAWIDYGEKIKESKQETDKLAETSNTALTEMKGSVDSWASGATDAFVSFAEGGKRAFGDLAESILEDIAKILIQANIIKPLLSAFGLTTAAHGRVFDSGNIVPFASGGIVTKPTLFPFASGVGLMGEAGPEAIMPLTRLSNGDLGVKSQQGNTVVNIFNSTDGKVSVNESESPSGGKTIDVMIESAIDGAINRGRFDKTFNSIYGIRRRGN